MNRTFWKAGITASLAVIAGVASAQGRLIAVDSSRALYEIDMNTGAKTSLGSVSANAGTTGGLAYDRGTGTLWLSSTSTDSLYTLDLVTGTATLVGAYGDATVVMHGLEFDNANGKLYGASGSTNNNFYEINKTTGIATLIGPMNPSGSTSFNNLGYNIDTDRMYGTHSGTLDSFYSVNINTGQMTLIGVLGGTPVSGNPNGLAYNWVNQKMYLADNSSDTLYTIDLNTGAATAVGSMGVSNILGLAFVYQAPSAFGVSDYAVNFGVETTPPGVANLQANDAATVQLCLNPDQEDPAPVQMEVKGLHSTPNPSSLKFNLVCRAEANDREVFIEMYNHDLGDWVGSPSFPVTDADALYSVNAPGTPGEFVANDNNGMITRITGFLGAADTPTLPCWDFNYCYWE